MSLSPLDFFKYYSGKVDVFSQKIINGGHWSSVPALFLKASTNEFTVQSIAKGTGLVWLSSLAASTAAHGLYKIYNLCVPEKQHKLMERIINLSKSNPADFMAASGVTGLLLIHLNKIQKKKNKPQNEEVK